MGVSGLLRHLIKKYPSIHLPAPNPLVPVHYLFIDFNAFIYETIKSFPTDVYYDFTKNVKENNNILKLILYFLYKGIRILNLFVLNLFYLRVTSIAT